jgi:putative PIN family toxin of toxin-antitoxin system
VRIVLDTNVLVSGLLVAGSIPNRCVDLAAEGHVGWLVDQRIVAEYRRVLHYPELGLELAAVDELLGKIQKYAEWITAEPLSLRIPDESDLPFIEVAATGGADALVTGNARHFQVKEGRLAIPVVSPRQFLDLLGGRAGL